MTTKKLPDAFYLKHIADFMNMRANAHALYHGLRGAGRTHAQARTEMRRWVGADVDYFGAPDQKAG